MEVVPHYTLLHCLICFYNLYVQFKLLTMLKQQHGCLYILSGLYIYDFLTVAINAVKLNVQSHLVDNQSVLGHKQTNHEQSVFSHLVGVFHLFHVLRVLHVLKVSPNNIPCFPIRIGRMEKLVEPRILLGRVRTLLEGVIELLSKMWGYRQMDG